MKFYQYNIRDLKDELYRHYYSLMSKEKKLRVDRFHFEDDKKRTIVGEMLARIAISEWFSIPEERIIFDISEYGKPYVKNFSVEFNISHSADMVVCVVDDKPVGVDIEKIRPVDLNIVKRIFNEEESKYIFGCVPDINDYNQYINDIILQRFFEVWTKKEAYGKLVGMGLFADPNVNTDYIISIKNGYCISIATSSNNN